MINLLPAYEKKEIRAGRVNVLLRRYLTASFFIFMLLMSVIAVFYFIMMHSRANIQNSIDQGRAKIAQYQSAQNEIDSFRKNLDTAKKILEKEIHYSKVITRIAATLPPGVILQSLNLSPASFGKPISLNALGRNTTDALTLKKYMEDSGIYSNVHLESVTNNRESTNGYPVTITINVTINPEVAKQ